MTISTENKGASQAKLDVRRELIAGVTTFFTMAYIVIVNPGILCVEGTGMPFSGVLTATVILSFAMTLLMGIYAKLPYAVAPGMGINAFFAYNIVIGQKVPWATALGIIFWAGLFFLLISVTPVRVWIARGIPVQVRTAAAAGIGIFLTFIGLKNAGIVVPHATTVVALGMLDQKALLSIAGLVVMVVLLRKRNPFAFLVGIFAVTGVAWLAGYVKSPEKIVSAPDFSSVFLKLDILGALKLSLLPAIVSILFTDLFDSISTFIGVATAAGLVDKKGEPVNLNKALVVDAVATMGAGLVGTSSGTAFIESTAGIEVGGRTGWTSIFTALCFLPCLFLAPLAGMVPAYATAPVLILVGALMFRSVARLSFERLEDAIPAFLTIILIPLTFSITQGILWGFVSYTGMYLVAGRGREVRPVMYVLAVLAIVLLGFEHGGWR